MSTTRHPSYADGITVISDETIAVEQALIVTGLLVGLAAGLVLWGVVIGTWKAVTR